MAPCEACHVTRPWWTTSAWGDSWRTPVAASMACESGRSSCTTTTRRGMFRRERIEVAATASGGEMSRVMLALLTSGTAPADQTFVFDEIDAGIGGHTARAVGEQLRALGRDRQVICITHLPQVAAAADRHYRLVKGTADDGRAITTTTLSPNHPHK